MKLRHRVLGALIVFFVLPVSSFAGENKPSTLTFYQALSLAAQKSPAVIMADERVRQALEQLSQARSYLFPKVDAGISESRQTRNLKTFGIPLSANTPALTPPFNAFDARISLTQRIFDMPSIRRLEAAGANKDFSSADLRKAKQDAIALAGSLYIEAERAHEALLFSRMTLRWQIERYDLAKVKWSQGTGSEIELRRTKTALSQARYQWSSSAARSFSTLTDLKTALGYSAGEPLALAEDPGHVPDGLPRVGDLWEHPDVQVAGARARLARAEERAAWSEFMPKISAMADYGLNGPSPSDTENTYTLGVQASMPVFDAGERWAAAQTSASRARESETAAADTERRTTAGALEARDTLKNARRLFAAKQDLFDEADRQATLARVRFQNGTASQLELLELSAVRAQARDERAEALAFYRTAQINLAHALGELEKISQLRD